jgi:ribosomal protein S18 acetylase RimI-like enzyme
LVRSSFEPATDMKALRKALERDAFGNAAFINRIFVSKEKFRCYMDPEGRRFLGVKARSGDTIFGGDWAGARLPFDLLPKKVFFVSCAPPAAIRLLKRHYRFKGEWPCWTYVRKKGFGKGPWDKLERLKPGDAPIVAKHWRLDEKPEPYIRSRIRKYESACVRANGKLVAWGGLHWEAGGAANMGFAHTMARHRRRGYATLVTKAMVNRIVARGNIPMMYVFKTNKASQRLCEGLGFIRIGEATWAMVGKRKVDSRS